MPGQSQTSWWRRLAIGILIGVAGLALAAYVPVHWAERQVLNTDNWVALVSPWPKNPKVATALGNYISNQVFVTPAVQQKISDALPPRAGFLAGPLAGQLKTLTDNTARKLVASDAFQTIWTGANRAAMNRLLGSARGQTPPLQAKINQKFDIDISGSSGKLSQSLGKAAEAIPALQPASQKVIDVSTDLKTRPKRVQQFVKTTDTLARVLPMLAIAALLSALALSSRRRRTLMTGATTILVFMLLELIALKWLRQTTLEQVHNPANLPAVSYIYDSLVAWLRHMIYWILAAMIVLITWLWAAGPAGWAESTRAYLRLERFRQARLLISWHDFRFRVKRHEYYLWLAALILVLVIVAALADVNGRVVINSGLLLISLWALLHIIATPPAVGGKTKN
jgi:hypothetical protein